MVTTTTSAAISFGWSICAILYTAQNGDISLYHVTMWLTVSYVTFIVPSLMALALKTEVASVRICAGSAVATLTLICLVGQVMPRMAATTVLVHAFASTYVALRR